MWNLKNKTNKQSRNRLTDNREQTYREQTDGGQSGVVLRNGVKKVMGFRSTGW